MVSRRNIGARAAGKQRAAAITVQDKKEPGAAALERRRSRKVIRPMMGKLSDRATTPVRVGYSKFLVSQYGDVEELRGSSLTPKSSKGKTMPRANRHFFARL
jgi:hypothetical protein